MKRFVLPLLALGILMPFSLLAQGSSFIVPVAIKNGNVLQVIRFGISPLNTFGVDTDTLKGPYFEASAPPKPPVFQLDTRFRTIPGRVSSYPAGLGGGSFKDIRDYRDQAQVDSFLIELSGSGINNDPTTVSWPAELSQFASACIIKSVGSTVVSETNMLVQTSVTIPSDPFATGYFLLIIKTGALAHDAQQASIATSIPLNQQQVVLFNDPVLTSSAYQPGIALAVTALGTQCAVQADRYLTPAKNVSFSGMTPAHVSGYRWVLTPVGATTITANVRFLYSQLKYAINNPGAVTVYRRAAEGTGPFSLVNTTTQTGEIVGDVAGFGEYIFGSDTDPLTDVESHSEQPSRFALEQNYPNPFNPGTVIPFEIPRAGHVRLSIHNVLGQEVATLLDESRGAGRYEVSFNASHLASGMYFYRLEAVGKATVRRMLLVK